MALLLKTETLFVLVSMVIWSVTTQATDGPASQTAPLLPNIAEFNISIIPPVPMTIPTECTFEGQLYTTGQKFDLESTARPGCASCSCESGQIGCQAEFKSGDGMMFGAMCLLDCNQFVIDARKRCEDPQTYICGRGNVNETWYQDGCQYTCTNNGLSTDLVQPLWCQRLSKQTDFCLRSCPVDRDEALRLYSDLFTFCKRKEAIVYHHELCDGNFDCEDKTDEENCPTVYCKIQQTKVDDRSILWQRTAVNNIAEISCSNFSSLWTGSISRQCMDTSNITGSNSTWNISQLCNCVPKHSALYTFNESLTTPTEIIGEAKRLYANARESLYSKTYLDPILLLMDQANKTEWNITEGSNFMQLIQAVELFLGLPDRLCRTAADLALERDLASSIDDLHRKYGLGWLRTVEKEIEAEGSIVILGSNSIDLSLDLSVLRANLAAERGLLNTGIRSIEQQKIEGLIVKAIDKAVSEADERRKVLIIEFITTSLSLIAVIATLTVFYILRMPNSTRLLIHKNLMVAYGLFCVLLICGVASTKKLAEHQIPCTIFISFFHYFFLASFTWMLMEGIHLILILVVVFEMRKRRHGIFMMLGWGIPLVILGIMHAIDHLAFIENKTCLNLGSKVWLLRVPILTIVVINFLIGTIVVFTIAQQQMKKSIEKQQLSKSLAKAFLVLSPLLGFFWIFGIFVDTHIVFAYISSVFNGMTGVAFFVFHCLLDKQVQAKAKYSNLTVIRLLSRDTMSTSAKSQTNDYHIERTPDMLRKIVKTPNNTPKTPQVVNSSL